MAGSGKTDCKHKKMKFTGGSWVCGRCDEVLEDTDFGGVEDIVKHGRTPMQNRPVEAYFSASLGEVVTSRADFQEKLRANEDPNRNEEHLSRPTPEWRQKLLDDYIDRGEVF